MKFILTRDIRDNPTIRRLLILYIVGVVAYLVLYPLLEHHNFGLSLSQMRQNLLGDPEVFIQPMSLEGLVEITHIKLFSGLVALITLFSAFVRAPASERTKIITMLVLFPALLIDALMPFLASSLGNIAIITKWVAFWTWELGTLAMSLFILIYLVKPKRSLGVSPQ